MGTVVITGANRGIGLELATQLKASGERVIALCRTTSSKLNALEIEVIEGVDVRQPDQALIGLRSLGVSRVDLLINNAGILKNETLGAIDYEQMIEQFEINTLGPLRVTETLLPLLIRGSKVAHITSRMGSIEDNTSGGRYGYRVSKAALNMASVSLAHDLKDQGISVCVLHPGFVRTDMTGLNGLIDTDESARGLIARIRALTLEETGGFWHSNGERLPW